MKNKVIVPILFLLVLSMLGPFQPVFASRATVFTRSLPFRDAVQKIAVDLRSSLDALGPVRMTTVIITLRQQAELSHLGGLDHNEQARQVVRSLQSVSNSTQGGLKKLLNLRKRQGSIKSYESLWVINGFSVTATRDVIHELSDAADVYSIAPDAIQVVPAAVGAPEPNISFMKAPALWNLGYTGQGIVVASMDSGVDVSHPDLASRWRGGTNSWYDPYGQHPGTPVDLSGHGTWTMGIMVGGDAGGTSIGIAPGARWISVKIFNDAGSATATAIHLGFQWLLDPDGNPNTDDAPRVVNNSWTYGYPGCNLEFEPDLHSLRSAGILPVFAAGNGGPSDSSDYSPANNPSAFAVGAVDNNGLIASISSRGPSSCAGSGAVFPKVVAPGVNILTSDLYSGFYNTTGTSLAAPHVSGGLALLLQANPDLSADAQENVLINSTIDLGVVGPDNVYGYGMVDLLSALSVVSSLPTATPTMLPPTAMATSTATATPTSTATLIPVPTATATMLPPTALPAPKLDHVGDLAGSSIRLRRTWNAGVTILVHDGFEQPIAGAVVSARWNNGMTMTCITGLTGICRITKLGLSLSVPAITFKVTGVLFPAYTYQKFANHDPGGDSNGTTIVVRRHIPGRIGFSGI